VEKKKFHYSYHTKSPSPKRSHSRNRSCTLGMTGYARTNWYQKPRRQGGPNSKKGKRSERAYTSEEIPWHGFPSLGRVEPPREAGTALTSVGVPPVPPKVISVVQTVSTTSPLEAARRASRSSRCLRRSGDPNEYPLRRHRTCHHRARP